MSKRKAEAPLDPPLEKRVKTPSKCCHACDCHPEESPSKLINKVTPSKTLTPSKESTSKPSDNKKTPTKDNKRTPVKDSTEEKKPSLFANLLKQPPIQVSQDKPSLFGSLLSSGASTNTGSLFQSNGQGKPSIFGSFPTSGGIFGNLGNSGGSLFANVPQGGLFNLQKFTSHDSEDEGDEEDGGEECKSPEINPEASKSTYQYDQNTERIIQKTFAKVKVNEKTCENGTISLEREKNEKASIILVLRTQAKLILSQGFILKKLTKLGTINKRTDSLTVLYFMQAAGKLQKNICKILFGDNKDCEEFKAELDKILDEK